MHIRWCIPLICLEDGLKMLYLYKLQKKYLSKKIESPLYRLVLSFILIS